MSCALKKIYIWLVDAITWCHAVIIWLVHTITWCHAVIIWLVHTITWCHAVIIRLVHTIEHSFQVATIYEEMIGSEEDKEKKFLLKHDLTKILVEQEFLSAELELKVGKIITAGNLTLFSAFRMHAPQDCMAPSCHTVLYMALT